MPARLPETWLRTCSVTSRRTPSRCKPVATDLLKSCSRQLVTPDFASNAAFAFDQLLKGPNTRSPKWGRLHSKSCAGADSGTIWVAPFLARVAGISQVERSPDNSAQ